MRDFFTDDSRVPGGIKLLCVLGLLTLSIASFFTFMSLWNDEDLPWKAAGAALSLTILTFLVVTNCSMEMEQWGRFKSNGRVWGLFLMSLLVGGTLGLSGLEGVQTGLRWKPETNEKLRFLSELDSTVQTYEEVKITFFELAETKLDQAFNNYGGRNAELIPGVKCVYGVESNDGISTSVRRKKKEALREAVNSQDESVLGAIKQMRQGLVRDLSSNNFLAVFKLNAGLDTLVTEVRLLSGIYQENFYRLDCPSMLVPGSGDLVDSFSSLTARRFTQDLNYLTQVKSADSASLVVVVLCLTLILLPIFFARPVKEQQRDENQVYL